MNKINEDSIGLYVFAGGWKSRPFTKSQFKKGDKVDTYHFGGSSIAGIGKNEKCKRGQYIEYWCTCGITYIDKISIKEEKEKYEWYKNYYGLEIELMNENNNIN
jgi:hypothetical protein